MKKDNPKSDVPPPDDPMHFPAKKPEDHPHPVQPIAPTPERPAHRPEPKERVEKSQQEAVSAAAVDVTTIAKADFNASQFKDAGNGWVVVQVKSPVDVYYGPGFPKPGEKFNYHGWNDISGPVRDGVCWLTIKPGGVVAAQPTEEEPGGWQLFYPQDGVIFCVPDEKQAFGFIYKRK